MKRLMLKKCRYKMPYCIGSICDHDLSNIRTGTNPTLIVYDTYPNTLEHSINMFYFVLRAKMLFQNE